VKFEADCVNEGCPTYGTRQLVSAHAMGVEPNFALDEDGNAIECEFCGTPLAVGRVSDPSAQFPLGRVTMTDMVKSLLRGGEEDPLAYAQKAADMVACHVSNTPETNATLFGDATVTIEGKIVTQHIYDGEAVWVLTNRERTETVVMLAREYMMYGT
jgi:hypothetical protein